LPAAPQAAGVVPPAHTPCEQQAPLHGWVALQPVVQLCEPLSQEAPEAQSPPLLQPQVPPPGALTQAEPTPLPAQGVQLPPELPQAAGEVPPVQVPPWQQPPLQACDGLQLVVQVWMATLHACDEGQSVGSPQPQEPPPLTATHTEPAGLVEQGVQVPPDAPQAVAVVPATQMPLSQQPWLHSWVGLQAVVQR
jgi:hypothetical protein